MYDIHYVYIGLARRIAASNDFPRADSRLKILKRVGNLARGRKTE